MLSFMFFIIIIYIVEFVIENSRKFFLFYFLQFQNKNKTKLSKRFEII